MSYMFVYRPTHQAVKVFCQPLVTLGDERIAAFEAMVNGGCAANDFSLDATGSENQVERSLAFGETAFAIVCL